MKKIKATFFNDGGHGWLAVKRNLLKELGILTQVSPHSYQKGETVYLEEDADISLLYNTLKDKHNITKLDDFFEIKSSYSERSPVRNYAPFNPNKVTEFKQGLRIQVYGQSYIIHSVETKNVIVQDMDGFYFKLKGKVKDMAILAWRLSLLMIY